MNGIPIIRVPICPSHDQSSVKRFLCYASLAASAATIGALAVKSADVAYVCQGPATLGLPAWVIKLLRNIPFVYHIQDLWPDSLVSSGMFKSKLGMKVMHSWCKCVYRQAATIAVIAPGVKSTLIERGVPESKIEVVYNWCDDSQLSTFKQRDPQLAEELGMAGRFNIVFAGNIGKPQALHTALKAAQLLQNDSPKVQFVLIGDGVEAEPLKRMAAKMRLTNVRFLKRRPVSEIGAILQIADGLLVHLRDDPLFRITIPSKTQAYLAAGRPVLIAVRGDAADVVVKANAGVCCEPENPRSMAAAVRKLQEMPSAQRDALGRNGAKFYQDEMSFAIAVQRFESMFHSVLERGGE